MPEKIGIDADEVLPDGTDIEYYVSADDSEWIPILPFSRSSQVTEFVPNVNLINNTQRFSRFAYEDNLAVQADGQAATFTLVDNVLSIPYPAKDKWYTITYDTDADRVIPYDNTFIRLKAILRRLRKDANATPILKSFGLYVEHSTEYHEVHYSDEYNAAGQRSGTSTT